MRKDTPRTSPRPRVLVVCWPDYYLEVFSDRSTDVHVAHVPVADTPAGEAVAEDIAELRMPRQFRPLFSRDKLVRNDTVRPVTVEALSASLASSDAIDVLNQLSAEEVVSWTL